MDASVTTQTFDWTSQEFLADPYSHYKRLRERDPVFFNESRGAWTLTRYKDMVEVLRDDERFSAERGPVQGDGPRSMLGSDPPHHTRLRTLVNKAFTPRTIRQLSERIQELVDQSLDRVESRGEMEAINEFAYPLPITVIAELLGVPAADQEFFRDQSQKIAVALGPIEDMQVAMRAMEGRNHLVEYFDKLIPERKDAPSDDLITALLQAEESGDFLSHGELLAMLLLLLVAGHETTVNLIGNGMLALLRNRDQLERLRNEGGIERQAIEELLRYDSPVQMTGRLAKVDVEIGGHHISAGQNVSTIVGSANRDPEQFPDPDTLDLTREPCNHLSFSAGIHFCLGAQLARLEGQIALTTIVRRFPNLKLATDELIYRPAPILRGLEALPIRF